MQLCSLILCIYLTQVNFNLRCNISIFQSGVLIFYVQYQSMCNNLCAIYCYHSHLLRLLHLGCQFLFLTCLNCTYFFYITCLQCLYCFYFICYLMSFFTDALFCCCNTVNFPTVGLIKEHLILSYLILNMVPPALFQTLLKHHL